VGSTHPTHSRLGKDHPSVSLPSSSWYPPLNVHADRHRLSTFRGLGDLVAWLLAGVGIQARDACGCGRRQKWLNRIVPFRFAGKSMFDRRSSVVASAVLVNRLGERVRGRIQVRAGEGEPRVVEFAELEDGARTTLFEGWTTDPRSRDRWTWMIEDGAGRIHTGSVVCAVEGPVEIGLEADPRARLALRQAHGACVVDLA
jgi:hypothetical protein